MAVGQSVMDRFVLIPGLVRQEWSGDGDEDPKGGCALVVWLLTYV